MTGQPFDRTPAPYRQEAGLVRSDRTGRPQLVVQQSDGSNLLPILKRLEETLQEETDALRRQSVSELPHLFQRKSQGLLELANVQRSLGGTSSLSEPVREALTSVRRSLDTNREVLKLHIDATSELIEIFAQAIREIESDGTYDQGYARPRAR
jgi:hypothetical protein